MRHWTIVAASGLLAMTMLTARGIAGAPATPDGAALFQQRCAVCHSTVAGRNGAGPSLAGLRGRKAGSAPGFAYSTALKASGLTWDAAQLDRYLANPQKAVPGTRMPVAVADPAQRAAIVRYLSGL